MPEQDHREAECPKRREPDLDVVEEVVPPTDVDSTAAGEAVAAEVESVDVQAGLGHETAGPLVPAAVFADAMDDQDSRQGIAGWRPVADVQRSPVGRGPLGSGQGRLGLRRGFCWGCRWSRHDHASAPRCDNRR